ncbi:cytochrome P450 [Rhizoctonia solani]|nr:cytochrome P450 [Rhizoctonia solani]
MINIPGAKPPIEQFPWMWYLPGFITGNWKDKVKEIGKLMDKLYCGLADIGWERGVSGLGLDNLAYKLRLGEGSTGMTRHRQAHVCGLLLEGGSDIVAAVISTCIMALVENDAYQKRAQGEIDALYTGEILPKWEDEQKMPFVRAVVKEALRWRTPLPMGVPHRNEQDDCYGGYFFPKGLTAIHLDPTRYEDPDRFKPERFLDHPLSMAESAVQSDPLKRDHFSFGAGRRSCPGIQVAEQDIFIALARLLWAFEFHAPPGASIVTDQLYGFFGEGIRCPKEFSLSVQVRPERRKATVEKEMVLAEESVYSLYGSYK